jgi:hypothetical protein
MIPTPSVCTLMGMKCLMKMPAGTGHTQTEVIDPEFCVEGWSKDFQTIVTKTLLREQLPVEHLQSDDAE